MAGAAEVLALSDDEDTPRSKFKPPSRAGTRKCAPTTLGNVVCLDSDDEAEVRGTPVVSAKVSWGGAFSELDDCCIVRITPSSSRVDGRLKSILEEDCSIVKDVHSSIKFPPRETTMMSDTGVQRPDPYVSQIFTDWTPDWSPDCTPEVEVEAPLAKRPKRCDAAPPCDAATPCDTATPCDVDMTLETGHDDKEDHTPLTCDLDMTLETGHGVEEVPCSVGDLGRSATRGKKISEEERQRRLREKELEFERKQAEKAEKKRETEEAKRRQKEEIKKKKEDEKARKAAAKKAAADRSKAEQDVAKFNGKAALKEMVAFVDSKVVEKGLIGGQLLSKFAQRNLTVKVEKNPLENSITWRTKRPSVDTPEIDIGSQDEDTGSQVVYDDVDIQYLIFVFEADEFSKMVGESSLFSHVRKAQLLYPGYTICYVVNKLTAFLKKKDQDKYQAPHDPANIGWQRPPVEKALAGLLTNFTGVRSRLCVDEAEVADHVTGLMPTLADSNYRPKLTKLSVCKNGDHVQRDDAFKEEVRESLWLKALVAIPKVSGPCAISIGRIYPTMRSLLKVYLDKEKTDREKELLLQDLHRETVFGSTGSQRKVGPVCSRQIFHVLMARDGNLKVDEIEQKMGLD